MKLGAENKNKVIAAAVLGTIGVLAVAYELSGWFGSSSASTNVPAPTNVAVNVAPRQRNSAGNRNATSKKDPTQTLDPSLRFDVLKSSEDTKYEGTGIGLSIVRKATERMGAQVGFDSQLGAGSNFWIQLKKA